MGTAFCTNGNTLRPTREAGLVKIANSLVELGGSGDAHWPAINIQRFTNSCEQDE